MSRGGLISIVTSCKNEAANLPAWFKGVRESMRRGGFEAELLVVDDGSEDGTWQVIAEQAALHSDVRGFRLSRNFGQQAALSAGMAEARGAAVVLMDADMQDSPGHVSALVAAWRGGADVAYAVRVKRKEGPWKRLSYHLYYKLLDMATAGGIPRDSGDFCIMDRRVVDVVNSCGETHRFLRGLRAWAGFRQVAIPLERGAREEGRPAYTARKLLALAMDGLISHSSLPLRLASFAGVFFAGLAGLGIALTVVQRMLPGLFTRLGLPPVEGLSVILIAILFLGGLQLLATGLIGEYLGRVYNEVKRRPRFVVAEKTGRYPGA